MAPRIPTDCPRCGKTLYPISAMRPRPRLSAMAMMGFVLAGVVAVGVYLLGFYLVRIAAGIYIPTTLLAPILIIPGVVVGILIALPFNRLPRVMRLRCGACKWGEMYREIRSTARARFAGKEVPALAGLGSARVAPETEPEVAHPADSAGLDEIVDDRDRLYEVKAWIYAEFVSGRTFEEISEELRGRGWGEDEVEGLVEEGRKATRHRRP
jgi:hypothetical protein